MRIQTHFLLLFVNKKYPVTYVHFTMKRGVILTFYTFRYKKKPEEKKGKCQFLLDVGRCKGKTNLLVIFIFYEPFPKLSPNFCLLCEPHPQVICQRLPLDAESLQKGFDLLKSRRAVGKIVFDLTKQKRLHVLAALVLTRLISNMVEFPEKLQTASPLYRFFCCKFFQFISIFGNFPMYVPIVN